MLKSDGEPREFSLAERDALELRRLGRVELRQRIIHTIIVWGIRLLLILAFIAVWEWMARERIVDPFFTGRPTLVLKALWAHLFKGDFFRESVATIEAIVFAFSGASLAGVVIGFVLYQVPILNEIIRAFLTAINSIPRIALAPLFIIWFGIGIASKIVLAGSLVFFIVLINTVAGAQNVDQDLIRLSRSLGASKRKFFLSVVLPWAMPSIMAGLELGVVYAILGVVVGEMLAATHGLGQLVSWYGGQFLVNDMMAVLLYLSVFTVVLSSVVSRVGRRFLRWYQPG